MKKPDKISVTTYWLDWILLPFMLGLAYLFCRWALLDYNLAYSTFNLGKILSLVVSIPLFIIALTFFIVGFASLIKEEYYELRVWRAVLFIWTLYSIFAGVITLWIYFIAKDIGLFNAVFVTLGFLIVAFVIGFPAFIKMLKGGEINIFSHLWTVLIFLSSLFLGIGVYTGFPFMYVKFGLGFSLLFFFATGCMEAVSKQPVFPWFPRIWKVEEFGKMEEFISSLPKSLIWRIMGIVKLLVSIVIVIIIII